MRPRVASAYRAPMQTQAERLGLWRGVVDAAQALAKRLADTCGRESVDRDFKHIVATFPDPDRFPVNDASAIELAKAFKHLARAAACAATDRRREICALALTAGAAAIDRLMTDQGHAAAQPWLRQFKDE